MQKTIPLSYAMQPVSAEYMSNMGIDASSFANRDRIDVAKS